jgi:hypothetical protein
MDGDSSMSTVREWLVYLWENENGFFGIGQGPSGEQKQQYGELTNLEKFGISTGEKDISKASDFWSSILSGDPTQISKVLGPAISTVNKQGQEQKKTLAEFGNRGGGTNAAAQNIDDKSLAAIRSMISNLTGAGAGALGSLGGGLLSTGLGAGEAATSEANVIQQENAAKWNDIFNSIAEIAGVAGGFFKAGSTGRKLGEGIGGILQG